MRNKERQRLKRQKKRQAMRRQLSAGLYQRIGSAGLVKTCFINEDWQERGQAVIYVLAGVPGGGHAMASFMVDLWCAVLKDAYGDLHITPSEFEDVVDRMSATLDLGETDVQTVRSVVAGAIRFADQNGFRLPYRYQRWVAVIGGVGDWKTADLSGFGVNGKLRWVAPLSDLKRRLIGESVEEFLARKDVEVIAGIEDDEQFLEGFEEDLDEEGQEEEDAPEDSAAPVDEIADMVKHRALAAVRRWCFMTGQQPHPRLEEAMDLTLESILQLKDSAGPEGQDDQADARQAQDNVARFLSLESPADNQELSAALDQVQRFMQAFKSPEELLAAMGLSEPGEEDRT